MKILPFEAGHLERIKVQPAQRDELERAEAPGIDCWTAIDGDTVVACGGLQELEPGRAYAYALLSEDAGPRLLALTRAIRFRLDGAPFARIEMVVERDFAAGCRWARLLGFDLLETPTSIADLLPMARGEWLYFARIKHGMGSPGGRSGEVRR